MAGMITKTDLETISSTRLEDARQLFRTERFSAAYYLAGYAVELGIKAGIAGVFQANAIPDKAFVTAIYPHKLDELLGLAGRQIVHVGGIGDLRRTVPGTDRPARLP